MTTVVDKQTLSQGARELLAAARNVNSQCGEDGIIEAILAMLPTRDRWCVEFGAWDGRHLSNTRRLIDEAGYCAVMIEADKTSFSNLKKGFDANTNVTCLQAFVGYNPDNGLDALLKSTPCPLDFDILSIDIDGNDIHVWDAIQVYRPKLVVIEFNPRIPSAVAFTQQRNPKIKWGSSLRALFELGLTKQYRLVCANPFNAFFVAAELWNEDYCRTADQLSSFRQEEPEPVYVFSGFDGTVHLSAECNMDWHRMKLRRENVQALPKFLRRYPLDYTWFQRHAFRIFKRFREKL